MAITPDLKNKLNSPTDFVGNKLSNELPSMPSSGMLPEAPSIDGVDPCSSSEYLKNKLGSMPVLGDMSLSDLVPNIDLSEISAPKLPKMPSMDDIKGGISDTLTDMKDGVTDAMDSLKPSNLIPDIKKELGAAGREALAGALENKMNDMLGPIKGGIGNRITRSIKSNLLMAGLSEVGNIVAGEPNIFDPCAGKDKLKVNSQSVKSAAEMGNLNNMMNTSVTDMTKDFAGASNKNAKDIVPVYEMPDLPAIGSAPALPSTELPGVFMKASSANQAATEKVAEASAEDFKQKASKQMVDNEVREQVKEKSKEESATASEPAKSSIAGNHFPPPKPPVVEMHFIESVALGPKPGWGGVGSPNSYDSNGPDVNDDMLDMLKKDMLENWVANTTTRGDNDVVYSDTTATVVLQRARDDVLSAEDIRDTWHDYIGSYDAEGKVEPTRHYMIWCTAMASSNKRDWISGQHKVTAYVAAKIYRTCDNCNMIFKNYEYHVANATRTALGKNAEEAFKNALEAGVEHMFQYSFKPEMMVNIKR